MHTDRDECSAAPIVLSAHAYAGLRLGLGRIVGHGRFFGLTGVYTGMGVISVWALLPANTVVRYF